MKKGISLIAVLMFMLAATTASIVLFNWISQENFGSGARLKKSEAYQASQAGLEAVQGWLTNKGADAGALISTFERNNPRQPVLVSEIGEAGAVDLLGGMENDRQQKFKVYLTGVDTDGRIYKMKFVSEGLGRDGSKYSQAGIFNVEGLYRLGLEYPRPKDNTGAARKVPPYFGGYGKGTQGNFSSGYIIGDMIATQGISSTEDLVVTGSVKGSSGMKIGCPNSVAMGSSYPGKDTYDANRKAELYGNFYVREDLTTQSIMICGDAYIGENLYSTGSIDVWGNLYVKGNITSKNALRVYGNVTVEGNITLENILDVKGNLVMPSTSNPAHTIELNNANNVNVFQFWGAETVTCTYRGADRCSKFTSENTYPSGSQIAPSGGDPLNYLGDQISVNKVNGKYIIPDPIVLGAAKDWKESDIPTTGCTELRSFGGYSNGVITLKNDGGNINGDDGARILRNAIHSCYNNSSGNWTSSNNSKWLVIRINWLNPNDAIGKMILGQQDKMNLIFVIENEPNDVKLPLTTDNTNILLYLTKGAGNIFLDRPPGTHNYFIYSEANVKEINGSQYLKGNLFMANGSEVSDMKDPRIEENEELFDILSEAGVITGNPGACEITVGGCGEVGGGDPPPTGTVDPTIIIGCDPLSDDCNPAVSYIPVIPHLKVDLQSQYANEEKMPSNPPVAEPAILVMPRAIYFSQAKAIDSLKTEADLFKRINVLYLNGAYSNNTNPTMKGNCNYIIKNNDKPGLYSCTIKSNEGKCSDPNLCQNSFYVSIGIQPNAVEPEGPGESPSSSSSASGGTSSSRSSSSVQSGASGLTCLVSPAVAEGSRISSAIITALCNYSDGTYDWADISDYYDGTDWIQKSDTTTTLKRGNNKSIRIKAKCLSTDQIDEYPCGTLNVVGITCNFTGLRRPGGSNTSTNTFAKGEQINGPTVNCSDNATVVKDNAIFSSNVSNTAITTIANINSIKSYPIDSYYADSMRNDWGGYTVNEKGWLSFNGFAYFASGAAGSHKIKVSNASCGNVSGLSAECSTSSQSDQPFNITDPTCTSASGSHPANSPIDVPVLCKAGVPMTNPVFNETDNTWINNGSGGVFTQQGTGKNIRLNSGECWGRKISGLNINCGNNLTITAPSGGDDDCYDYDPAWCGYISHANVQKNISYLYPQTGTQYDYDGSSNGFDVGAGGRCIFAASIQAMGNTGGCSYYRVNGVELKGSGGGSLDVKDTNSGNCSIGSGRCGRIDLATSQPAWGQQFCSNALTNVPKVDGGYYIYVAPGSNGSNGWAGDFVTTRGTPVCSGGGSSSSSSGSGSGTCEYEPAYCGGMPYSQVKDNTDARPAIGECIYYSKINKIQANTGELCVSGACKNNWGGWYNTSDFLGLEKDEGYYVYCKTAPCIESFEGVLKDTKKDCTPTPPGGGGTSSGSGTPTISCNTNNLNSCYVKNNSIPRPNASCSNGNATTADFRISGDNGAGVPAQVTGWNNVNGNNSMGTARTNATITLHKLMCDGTDVTPSSPVNCGTITIAESSCAPTTPTATCTFSNPNVKNGQNIPPPTISCSSGDNVNIANVNFGGNLPQNANNWKNNNTGNNVYYSGSESENPKIIDISNITCGNTNNLTANCTINLSNPTCSINSPVTSGVPVTPNIDCGGTPVTNINFNTNGCSSWSIPDQNSTSGSFSSTSTVTCNNLILIGLKCGDNPITTNINCGTITVNASGGGGTTPIVIAKNVEQTIAANGGTITIQCNDCQYSGALECCRNGTAAYSDFKINDVSGYTIPIDNGNCNSNSFRGVITSGVNNTTTYKIDNTGNLGMKCKFGS